MKKTTLKSLEAQQKVFTLLAAPSRIRVLNQLMATPNLTVTELINRTGLMTGTTYQALSALAQARMLKVNGRRYSIEETALSTLTNLCEDATDLRYLLSRVKAKKPARSAAPQLRAVSSL